MGFTSSKEPPKRPISYFVIGGDKEIIKEFSINEENNDKKIKDFIQWDAKIYPDLLDKNIESTFEDLTKIFHVDDTVDNNDNSNRAEAKSLEEIKKVIMIFGKNNAEFFKEYSFFYQIPKLYLPQIVIITEENFEMPEGFIKDLRYVSIIKENFQNREELIKKITSYMWEKECYYNERGNAICDYSPIEIDNSIQTKTYLNIMVTGLSRSGKSTLINLLSDKLVSLESNCSESVTQKVTEYYIYPKNHDIYKYGIKIFDTPGLVNNTINIVKEAINNKIKEVNDSRNDIHIIYFLLEESSNLVDISDFFQFLIDKNNERKKIGKKKIPLIFIVNRSKEEKNYSISKYLKDHNFEELYEKFEVKQDNKNLSILEKLKKKNKSNELTDNIISVNLLSTKSTKMFGISSIFKATLKIIKKIILYMKFILIN